MKIRRVITGPRAGFINIAVLGFGLVLSFISARMALRRPQPPFQDAPTPLTTRNARIPVVIGRRQVPAIHAAVGLRSEVGSGGSPNYREEAWHILCVGPMRALHGIYQEGAPISPATVAKVFPITPATHAGGTVLFIQGYGRWVMQWGEETQAIDPLLATLLGVSSRWLGIGGIVYRAETSGEGSGKDLGPTPFWATISHDVEVAIQRVGLTQSIPYWDEIVEPDADLSSPGEGYPVLVGGSGNQWHGNWVYLTEADGVGFVVGRDVIVTDASDPSLNGTYRLIGKSQITALQNPPAILTADVPLGSWKLSMIPSRDWDADTATLTPILPVQRGGANVAHAMWQLIFGGWPHGLALDRAKFDMESLEQIGVYFEENPAPINMALTDGLTVEGALTRIMQDHGIVRTWTRDGKIRFVLLREPAPADIVQIPADAIIAPLPEIQTQQGPVPTTRVLFEFADIDRSFQPNVIPISNDGESDQLDFPRDKQIKIHTVTDYASAEAIANRKAQEELGRTSGGDAFVGRQFRDLANGQVVALAGYSGTWRVMGIGRDTMSPRTRLQLLRDPYDVAPAAGIGDQGGAGGPGGGGNPSLIADLEQGVLEIPPWWGAAIGSSRAAFMRVKATAAVIASQVYTSSTAGGIASPVGAPQPSLVGLSLDAAISAGSNPILGMPGHAAGPAATLIGPDAFAALDLSADDTAWLTGSQVAVIGSGPDAEVCFVRVLTATGGAGYTLDGLVRAQYDTVARDWPAGTVVYVGPRTSLVALESATFAPAATRYFKCPAQTATESVPLAEAAEIAHTFRGANVWPVAPAGLRGFPAGLDINVPAFRVGDVVSFDWCQRRADLLTGYGQQPYGDVHTPAPVLGEMIHRIYADDNGSPASSPALVVNQGGTIGASYTYAQLFTMAGAPLEALTPHADRTFWFSAQHRISGNSSSEVFIKMTPV